MLWLLLTMILAIALAWHRAGLRTTTAAIAGLLLAYGVFGGAPLIFAGLLLLFAGVFVPLSLPTLREEWLSRPLLDRVQRRLLPAHAARIADDRDDGAGDRQWLAGMPALNSESTARAQTAETLRPLIAALDAVAAQRLPQQLAALASLRLFAPSLPSSHGGRELDAAARGTLLQGLSGRAGGAALAQLIADFDAAARVIHRHGSEAQHIALLPLLADGRTRLKFAQGPRWRGSDRAVVARGLWKGRETIGLIIDADQWLVYGEAAATAYAAQPAAAHATDIVIEVEVSDPERLLGETTSAGPTLLRIPVALLKQQSAVQGIRISASALFLPMARVIGDVAGIGQGAGMLATAASEQAASVLAIRAGTLALKLRHLSLQTRIEHCYQLPPHSDIERQRALVDQALDAYGSDALAQLLSQTLDSATPSARLASLARRAVAAPADSTDSADSTAPRFDAVRQAFALMPALRQTLQAAAATPYGIALQGFDARFWPLLGELLAHQAQALLLALSDGAIASGAASGRHGQRLQRYQSALAVCGDLRVLSADPVAAGGRAETALQLAYAHTLALAAALAADARDGKPRNPLPLLDAYCQRCAQQIESALDAYVRAQPGLLRRGALRLLLLPLGRWRRSASELRVAALAQLLQAPGDIRERLRRGLPAASASDSRLEAILDEVAPLQARLSQKLIAAGVDVHPPLQQISEGLRLKLIDAAQADRLRTAYNLSEDWRLKADVVSAPG